MNYVKSDKTPMLMLSDEQIAGMLIGENEHTFYATGKEEHNEIKQWLYKYKFIETVSDGFSDVEYMTVATCNFVIVDARDAYIYKRGIKGEAFYFSPTINQYV